MPKIPINTHTTQFVLENKEVDQGRPRDYLGLSSIGAKCLRSLWYGFHWASPRKPIPIRVKRIFDRGDIEEARIIKELVDAGMTVYKEFEENGIKKRRNLTGMVGEKQEELIGFAGHAKGHPDGRVLGVIEAPEKPHLLEMKTAKASKFREFVKSGVRVANQQYFFQAQSYMSKMGLDRCLFIVTNKDTEERYYERIKLDKRVVKESERREAIIITATEPPEKLSQNRNWIDCKWCKHREICHEDAEPEKNCRTCENADIADSGKWLCGLSGAELNVTDQLHGCRYWVKGWKL